MEVNAIFADKVKVDEKNNFRVDFQNEDEIVELLLNQQKDYYLTNAITFIENKRIYSKAIKDLENIAKKQLQAEQNAYLDINIYSSIRLVFVTDEQIFDKSVVPFWSFSLNINDLKKCKKEYKYLNNSTNEIETFRTYDFLNHILDGITFTRIKLSAWIAAPIENITLKLVKNDTQIAAECEPPNDRSFTYMMYQWANTIIRNDHGIWYTSHTGWLEMYRRILDERKRVKSNRAYYTRMLESTFAEYFWQRKTSALIKHIYYFDNLSSYDKKNVAFVVLSHGKLRVNFVSHYNFYVGGNSSLHINFANNFLGKSCEYMGVVDKDSMLGVDKLGKIPYKKLHQYRLLSTFNRDDYWFDENAYMITEDYTLPKKIVTKKYNYIQSTDFFPTLTNKKNLTAKEQKDIKSFNNYDKEVALAKLNDIAHPSEHAYFLYNTQNLIRETFISEINKQVNLIGSISFFDKIAKDGKIQLIKTKDKLKFDVKKNAVISYLEFNLSPTHASKK